MKKKIVIAIIAIILILVWSIAIYMICNPKVAVLCYHNIGTQEEITNFPEEKEWTIDVDNFEQHLKMLNDMSYKSLTLDEFYKWKKGELDLPYKSVLLTFDDGFLSNYEYAFPLLKKYGIKATVFLIGNYTKESNEEWNGNLRTYMSKEIIEKAKIEYPNIEFASHSYGLHENGILNSKKYEEIVQDIEFFNEKMFDTNIYCYPFGAYNDDMVKALKEERFKMAFIFGPTNKEYRKASRDDDDFLIPRLNVSYGIEPSKLFLRLIMPF